MPSSPANAPSPSDPAALPSQQVRTAVSLALFIYLFTLAVGVIARDVHIAAQVRSPNESSLEAALGNIQGLRHLRQLLWMDDSYDYYLTQAEEIDVDHSITADVLMPNGSTESIVLPDPATRSPLARRRWQLLAHRLAVFSSIPDPDLERARDILIQGVAAHVLAETGGKSVVVRVKGHPTLPRMEDYNPKNPTVGTDPRDVYAARAWISGGRVNLLKQESKVDAAPAARSP